MRNILFLTFILGFQIVKSQGFCKVGIKIDELNRYSFLTISKDTLEEKITSDSKYRYVLKDCYGTLYIEYIR